MRWSSKRTQALLFVVLLVANFAALNLIVAGASPRGPLGAAVQALRTRIDLTEGEEYTISDATRKILAGLPDTVTIHAYFSAETHPKLQPLVPRIRDLLEEYQVAADGKVQLEFADPSADEDLAREVYQRFGIRPTPFRVQSLYESGVKSAYFHLVVSYGDQYETLGFDDLVRVEPTPSGDDVTVRLANLEYALTRAIEKVVRSFGTLETRLAELEKPVRVEFYITDPDKLPADAGRLKDYLEKRKEVLDSVAKTLRKRYEAGLEVRVADPSSDPELARKLQRSYRIGPLQPARGKLPAIWLAAVVLHEGRGERIAVQGDLAGTDDSFEIRSDIEAAIRRLLPGAMRTVGLVTSGPNISAEQRLRMQMMGQRPPSDGFDALRELLRSRFEVRDVSLEDGRPPLEVDVLLVLAPDKLDERERFALDQYLMLGGKVIACVEAAKLDLQNRMGLQLKPVEGDLAELLSNYGIGGGKELVLDDRNFPYPLPVEISPGLRVIQDVRYPWFVDVRADGLASDSPIVAGVDRVVLLWPTALSLDDAKTKAFTERGGKVQKLLFSSERSWRSSDLVHVEPQIARGGGKPYVVPDKTERSLLAVALAGRFESAFKGKPVPEPKKKDETGGGMPGGANPFGGFVPGGSGAPGGDGQAAAQPDAAHDEGAAANPAPGGSGDATAKNEPALLEPITESVDGARLVVIGDADWLSDIGARVMGQEYAANLRLLENLIDWSLLDPALLEIRAHGARSRPLRELDKAHKKRIEAINYAVPTVLVVLLGWVRWTRRRRAERKRGGR